MQRVTIVTAPAVEPVALPEARLTLGLDAGVDAPVIMQHLASARELVELFTGRTLITTTLRLHLDAFPGIPADVWWDGVRDGVLPERQATITLPRPPIQATPAIIITYADSAGTTRTVDATTYYLAGDRIILTPGSGWPSARFGTIQITYAAGYGSDPSDVPGTIRSAIIAHARDCVERPNASISSERVDNASVTYGAQRLGTATGLDAAGGLRGGAAAILHPYRTLRLGA